MSIKENVTNLRAALNASIAVAGDGALNGIAVDNADYELGLSFFAYTTAFTDGVHTLGAEESEDNGVTDPWTAVPAEKLVIVNSGNVVSAAIGAGAAMAKVGVFSNKRYVRPTVTSTGVTTGATLQVLDVQEGEYQPVG